MAYPSTSALRRALELQIKIEALQHELSSILGGTVSIVSVEEKSSVAVAPVRRLGRPKGSGRKRGRGPGRPPAAAKALKIEPEAKPEKAAKVAKPGRPKKRVSPLKGKKRPTSPSGPLGASVIKVLKRAGRPLSVDDVFQGLSKDKYVWNVAEPKKNLSARIYKMKGVKKVAPGLFDLAK